MLAISRTSPASIFWLEAGLAGFGAEELILLIRSRAFILRGEKGPGGSGKRIGGPGGASKTPPINFLRGL